MLTRETCRVCEGAFESILNLGEHFVSDFPKPSEPDGLRAPLELVLCKRCRLLQLKHTVDPNEMYRNYWYRSGTNQTMRMALADIANTAETLIHLCAGDVVLDIGCNDGTLLSSYKTGGIRKVGMDPSNVAQLAQNSVDTLVNDFFCVKSYRSAMGSAKAKIVTSIAMFYDLDQPNEFVRDVKQVLEPGGLWIIQMSYLPLMLKTNEFGNVCHEHLEYYSLQSLEYLLAKHDFEIVDVSLNDVNGGSLRAYIRNRFTASDMFGDATYRELAQERVKKLREQEFALGLGSKEVYMQFARRVERIKQDTVDFVRTQNAAGRKVYVYGASTKGNTVLQYFGLNHQLIVGAAERNSEKWGRCTVGTRIPIVSEEDARSTQPDFFLILPWHFLEEFMAREQAYLNEGGRFIVPFPHFTLI